MFCQINRVSNSGGGGVKRQGQCLTPLQRKRLEKALQTNLKAEYRRRIEIMLRADQGQSQKQICQELQCTRETARYWILMAQTGQVQRWEELPLGRPKTVTADYLNRLQELVNHSPRDYGYAFRHWTCSWLSRHLARELGIQVSSRHVSRLLKSMGCSTKPAHTNFDQTAMNPATANQTAMHQPTIAIYDLPATSSQNNPPWIIQLS